MMVLQRAGEARPKQRRARLREGRRIQIGSHGRSLHLFTQDHQQTLLRGTRCSVLIVLPVRCVPQEGYGVRKKKTMNVFEGVVRCVVIAAGTAAH